MSEIDALWERAVTGDKRAFGDWMGRVERPIRRALQPYARLVDAEGVVQEMFLRMWLYAQDRGGELAGENASLRWAIGMARNVARNEARKRGREVVLPPDDMPEPVVEPETPADPFVARAIRECLGRLARRPLAALRARLDADGARSDKDLAALLGMSANAFLQNIVRARRQLDACLAGKGVHITEVIR